MSPDGDDRPHEQHEAATSASVGQITLRTDSGVTVAEIEMNSRPMVSWTTVLSIGRSSGTSTAGRFARAMPITMAAMSPVSSLMASHTAATPTTVARIASLASRPRS